MSRKASMTWKLIVTVTGVVALSWVAAAGLGVVIMQGEFSEIFDSGVQETAERLLPLVVDDLSDRASAVVQRDLLERSGAGKEYLSYQARNVDGQVLLHSHGSSSKPFASTLKVGFSNTPTQRIYTAATADGALFVQVADSFRHRREAIIEGGVALFLPLLALLPISIMTMILVARFALTPLQGLRDDIGRKDSGNMAPVDEGALPRELHPIAHSVNLLLERLRSALEAERGFTANSAHELRTPIAGALAQTQRLRAEVPANLSARVGQIERSLLYLGRLAEKLLQMSRAEAGIGVSDVRTDLMPVLDIVLEDVERSLAGRGRISLHRHKGVQLEYTISPDAFGILFRNLVENALIHSPAGSTVEIHVETGNRIRVVNTGPLIDPPALQGLTARFTRGPTQAAGSGLGLSIVKRLVGQMNGSLVLHSPARGREDGFEAEIRLPEPAARHAV